jgi:hypothetical protein
MIIRTAASLIFCLFSATAVFADNFRCPNGSIVSTGDSISLVAVKCDKPTFVVSRQEAEDNYRGRPVYVEVQEWTYNEGPHRLIHFLVFRNGKLVEVKSDTFGK